MGKMHRSNQENGHIAFIGIEEEGNGLYEAVMRPKSKFNTMLALTNREKSWHDRPAHGNIQMINKTLPLVNGIVLPKISNKMVNVQSVLKVSQKDCCGLMKVRNRNFQPKFWIWSILTSKGQ